MPRTIQLVQGTCFEHLDYVVRTNGATVSPKLTDEELEAAHSLLGRQVGGDPPYPACVRTLRLRHSVHAIRSDGFCASDVRCPYGLELVLAPFVSSAKRRRLAELGLAGDPSPVPMSIWAKQRRRWSDGSALAVPTSVKTFSLPVRDALSQMERI